MQSAPHEKALEAETHPGVDNTSGAGGEAIESQQSTNGYEKADEGTGVDNEIVLNTVTEPPSPPLYSVFSSKTKVFVVLMTVFSTFFSPFSSFMYLPAITPIADSYGRSLGELNLSVTVFQIMQALAPLFFGDLSDQIGRRPVYIIMFVVYLGANIGLALQNSYAALMVLRALQSTGSSATVAIGNAVMADVTTAAERGGYITAVQASIQFAPALAPALGGILIQYWGWRSSFWFLVIAAGVFLVIYVPFAPETARNIVGNGSIPPPRLNASLTSARQWRRRRQRGKRCVDIEASGTAASTNNIPPPPSTRKVSRRVLPVPNVAAAVLIIFEKDVGLLLFFMSLFVMANFAMLIPLQDVIRRRYGLTDLQVGLCYMPFAFGAIAASLCVGRLLNWNYARVARSIGVTPDRKRGDDLRHFPIEQARLDLMWPWTGLAVAVIVSWGWVVDSSASLAAPLVILFLSGAALSGPIAILITLLVDLYPMNPGRVSSTFNLTRAAMSATGTAVVQYIIDAWGYGYTYLFMGLLVLAASPCVWIVRTWGHKWREQRYQRFERMQASVE